MEYNEELYDKEEKDFRQYIRRYPTKEILKWINSISNDIFDNDKDNIGAKWDKIQLYAKNSRVPITQKIIIQPWFLLDLAYYSIKYGNDFRNKKIERIEEFYELYNYFMSIMNKKEKLFLPKIREDKNRFYLYLFGFAGEQFKYQNMRPFDNLSRDLYIIFELSKNDCKNSVFENIVREEVGVSWEKVIYNLMFAICGYMCCDTLEEIIKNSSFELEENKNDLERVLAYYTASYQEIKDECIERQIFFSKPFIKNQRNEIVTISPYQNLLVYEHCIFWIVRNYYKKKNSQEFINYFGELFEKYFRELLCECLGSDEFEKNKECDRKRADWKIQLGKYKILIEQKSAILSLLVKQQNSQVDEFSNYINKKIKKAIEQLKCTEEDFGDGKYIKIVLLYEDYIKPEALENFYEFEDENDKLIWFASISEMERLLYLYKMDKNKIIKIMEEKIEAEKSNSKDGKSIEYLLNKYSISNEYLKREKMKYYRECAWESVRKLADCDF